MSSQYTVGLGETGRVSSKVLRPPGGVSSIFGGSSASCSEASSTTSGSRETSPPHQRKPYKMASNFELGDEQPSQAELVMQQQNRRRSKPSINPLTGEVVGVFVDQRASPAPSTASNVSQESSLSGPSEPVTPVREQTTPTRSGRVPPGGYSTPLW